MVKLLVAIAVIAALYMYGTSGSGWDEFLAKISAFTIAFVIGPVIYLFYIIRTPAKLDAELVSQIQELESGVKDVADAEAVIEVFGRIHKEASNVLDGFMGGDEPEAVELLMGQIEKEAPKLDARRSAIVLSDSLAKYDYKRWQGIVWDDDEFPRIALLALRVQSIEKAFGF
ncbi:hypothetical protein [Paenochrobactrum pullorum]|uniref:hypothetical protein n=1 Tax=Paenochrobactrum pullorum TaxID=1324351 RepID=UPI0035BBA9CC